MAQKDLEFRAPIVVYRYIYIQRTTSIVYHHHYAAAAAPTYGTRTGTASNFHEKYMPGNLYG